jgi:hypothetical protein
MSASDASTSVSSPGYSFGALLRAGAIAGIIAAAVNLILYLVAKNVFDVSFIIPMQGPGSELGVLPWPMVVIFSFIPAILAAAFLWLLARFLRHPLLVFQIVAVVLLILSFGAPLNLGDDADTPTKVWLELMHVVAGVAIIGSLTMAARAHEANGSRTTAQSGAV